MAVRAGIANLESSGVFGDAIRDWRKRPEIEHTMTNFNADFKLADAERQRQLTTKSAGYHHVAARATRTADNNTVSTPINTDTPTALYYCWTHGAGPNSGQTSQLCNMPAPGHRHEASITNMLGGNNIIHQRRGEVQVFVPVHRAAAPPAPVAAAAITPPPAIV
jgi:hypothetical protein